MDALYQVWIPQATFGIVARGTRVTEAAPIARWMVGRTLTEVAAWVEGKRGRLRLLSESPFPSLLRPENEDTGC